MGCPPPVGRVPTPFLQGMPAAFPPAGYSLAPAPRPANASVRPPAAPAPRVATAPPPPRVVRGQRSEEPKPPAAAVATAAPVAPLRLPSPEELGLALPVQAAPPAGAWSTAHAQLQRLGATGLHLDPVPGGGWRVSFTLPSDQPSQVQRVRAEAATPDAAVQLALTRADALRAQVRR